MNSDNKYERALQQAREHIDNEWLATGVTREELEQDARMVELLSNLVKAGHPLEDLLAEWEEKSPAEILRDYATPEPVLRSA